MKPADKLFCQRKWQFETGRDVVVVTAELHSLSGQHPYFSMTYEAREKGSFRLHSCGAGCENYKSELEKLGIYKFLRWHLTSTDEPMYYIANSIHHLGHSWKSRSTYERFEKSKYAPKYDRVKAFKECCIYGAVEGDELFKPEDFVASWPEAGNPLIEDLIARDNAEKRAAVTKWLEKRKPKVMAQFAKDMYELFPNVLGVWHSSWVIGPIKTEAS